MKTSNNLVFNLITGLLTIFLPTTLARVNFLTEQHHKTISKWEILHKKHICYNKHIIMVNKIEGKNNTNIKVEWPSSKAPKLTWNSVIVPRADKVL